MSNKSDKNDKNERKNSWLFGWDMKKLGDWASSFQEQMSQTVQLSNWSEFFSKEKMEKLLSKEQLDNILKFMMPINPMKSIEEELERLRKELPPPCLFLIGEPQVGKSTIVRTLTGDTEARIGFGDGIAVTKHLNLYHFPPEAELPLWIFLDTPGLGAAKEDEEIFEDVLDGEASTEKGVKVPVPDVVLVVVRVDDTKLGVLPWAKRAVETLKRYHEAEEIPILVVQTSLHRLLHPHPMPYPFGKLGDQIPDDLDENVRKQLMEQREKLREVFPNSHFVLIDITDPEDEVGDPFYGAEALFESTYRLLPETIRNLIRQRWSELRTPEEGVAEELVWRYASVAAAAGALPPPLGDVATLGISFTMLRQLAVLYEQEWEIRTVLDLLWSLGSTTLVLLVLRYLIRRVPIPIASVPMGATGSFSLVFALGRLMDWYYSNIHQGRQPSDEEIQRYWDGLQDEAKERVKEVLADLWAAEKSKSE